MIKTTIRGFPG